MEVGGRGNSGDGFSEGQRRSVVLLPWESPRCSHLRGQVCSRILRVCSQANNRAGRWNAQNRERSRHGRGF
ncbi:unnamed protein product [Lampetra planeri]